MYKNYIKRFIDIILSLIGLIILIIPMGLAALLIVIEDPGSPIFTQKRVGIHKTYFNLYKFRSMKMSTPHDIPTHMLKNPEQYILKIGGFIRKTSIDELPQLFNILKGDMSIIGPRPALWNQDDLVAERDKYGANDVTPGLTGWAQVNGRDELEIPVKAKFDGEYSDNVTFLMDVKCFFLTVYKVFKHEGVVEGGTGEIKNRKKKIAVLSCHTPSLFWFRMDMMKSFIDNGYEVVAISNETEDKWAEDFKKKKIKYRSVEIKRNGVNPIKDLKGLLALRKVLKEEKPDKIFTYQAKTVIYGTLAANSLGIKEVYPLIAGIGSVYLNNDIKSRLIRIILNIEYRISLRNVNTVFFQNSDDLKTFKDNGIIKDHHIVMLNGSGVNLKKFPNKPLPEKFGFLFIGRLIKDKGIMEYLKASEIIKAKYPKVNCLLVGPFDSNPSALKKEELDYYVNKGIIKYYGEQKNVAPYINKCSVFVLPSYAEGTPKTVLEAMAVGRAIITCDTRGCKETVENGYNGYLVKVKDIEDLANKMEDMIKNQKLVAKMAKNSRKLAVSKYDVNLINDKICSAMNIKEVK